MSFKNLEKRQAEMKARLTLNSPIVEFRRLNKTTRIKRKLLSPIVYVLLGKNEEVLYVGRIICGDLIMAIEKFHNLSESEELELFPFSRDDAAESFQRRLIYHFEPRFNREKC